MQPGAEFTRKIGSTTYRVQVFFIRTKSVEDRILHLVREEGLDISPKRGILKMPQMSREPERKSA